MGNGPPSQKRKSALGLKKEAKIPARETAVDHLLFLMMQVTHGALASFFLFYSAFAMKRKILMKLWQYSAKIFAVFMQINTGKYKCTVLQSYKVWAD